MKTASETHNHLLDYCSQPTLLLDREGQVQYKNEAAESLFKQRFSDPFYQVASQWFQRFYNDKSDRRNVETIRLEESGYSLLLQFRRLPNSQDDDLIILEVKDQTEHQRYLSLLEQSRKQDEHNQSQRHTQMASVIHELKTPLNAIFGFTQLCKEKNESESLDEFLQTIMDSAEKMTRMVNELLAISKRESEAVEILIEKVDIESAIKQTLKNLSRQQQLKDCTIDVELDQIDGVQVFADPLRLEQILSNLLINGAKYGCCERLILAVSVRDDSVCLAVIDHGAGVDPSMHDALFEPFKRLGRERSDVEGTGLGLYLSKQLVERMGGVMGYQAAEPQGSEFWFTLARA